MSPELLIGVISVAIGIILAVFGPTGKYVGERRYGAEKRADIIHLQLIADLEVVMSVAEGVDSLQEYIGKLHDAEYACLLLSNETREKLNDVVEAKKRYSGARKTCIKIAEVILQEELESHLKKTDQKIKEKELWKDRGYKDLESMFTNNVSSFLLSAVKEHDINAEWFKERFLSLSYWNEIEESIEKGESLEKFLSDVDEELKRNPAVQWLREERNKLLTLSKECKEMLELERKDLYSWKGFFYGWGKRTTVEDLENRKKLSSKYI